MKNYNLKLTIIIGLLAANTALAIDPVKEASDFDVNSIREIENEIEIDLGFDTADYLPENFDPYAYPTNVEGINFIDPKDDFEVDFDTKKYLPEGFDPYKRNR